MCGIIGCISNEPVNQIIYDGLVSLQHRGQDAAGIITNNNGRFHIRKDHGLVKDIFHTIHMTDLKGNIGIGHVRYPTSGNSSSREEVQPFYYPSEGFAFVHNGNIVNIEEIRNILKSYNVHLNTNSDSEALGSLFITLLRQHKNYETNITEYIQETLIKFSEIIIGSYSCICILSNIGILAFRDPHGIRPLEIGERDNSFMFASESVAFDISGYRHLRSLANGWACLVTYGRDTPQQYINFSSGEDFKPCIFEYVYIARPDSVINGISVSLARKNMGTFIAKQMREEIDTSNIDIVVPVPDTSVISAAQIGLELNIPCVHAIVKSKYVPRTFIMPDQKTRDISIRHKLNVISAEVKGKNIIVVDDSIVRGTTSKKIVSLLKKAGANRIIFVSLSPQIKYQNVYGIDIPTKKELISANLSCEEVRTILDVDELIFLRQEYLEKSIGCLNIGEYPRHHSFETSIFDGNYLGGINKEYLDKLENNNTGE